MEEFNAQSQSKEAALTNAANLSEDSNPSVLLFFFFTTYVYANAK